ncbi:MAG: hypothetical protein DRH08_10760 [Deltaproteobacteria bacterium]|nr:MAG: hypothetical protein DRH08_10760 [Deltaproteobacteria bacterium]
MTAFSNVRKAGIRAISLLEDEHLISARETDGNSDIIMASSSGLAIRFNETDCRSMGRTARGVRGLRLQEGQEVIGMITVGRDEEGNFPEDVTLLSITDNGYGKRTPLSEYRIQHRGGKGLITIKCSDRNGPLMGIRDIFPGEELMVITRKGIMIRISLDSVSSQSRNTQGVRIINLKGDDLVGSIAKIGADAVGDDDVEDADVEVIDGGVEDADTQGQSSTSDTPEETSTDDTSNSQNEGSENPENEGDKPE